MNFPRTRPYIEPDAAHRESARQLASVFNSYLEVGMTRREALELTKVFFVEALRAGS